MVSPKEIFEAKLVAYRAFSKSLLSEFSKN